MTKKCDQRGSKPQNLIYSKVTMAPVFMHLLEELEDGKEEGEWGGVVPLNRRPQGRSLWVMDGQTPTARCEAARLDTAGNAPGRRVVDVATIQGGALNAFFIYFCSQAELCSLHVWPDLLSLHCCCALERFQF